MKTLETNPYAPPTESSAPQPEFPKSGYLTDGHFLYLRDGAALPDCCLVTNAPTGEGDWRRRVTMAWTPRWVFILILVNVLVLLIVAAITQKKAKIAYSLSREVRGKIVKKRWLGIVLVTAAIGAVVLAVTADWPGDTEAIAGLGGGLSLILGLICFAVANPLKVRRYKDGWFQLKGCSPGFLATLPVERAPI